VAVPSKSVPLSSEGSKKVSEKTKAIDAAILQIEKQFGKGSIMKLGAEGAQTMDVIPSASTRDARSLAVASWDSTPEEKIRNSVAPDRACEGR